MTTIKPSLSTLLSILLMAFFVFNNSFSIAQDVNIPDANFKSYLVGNASINLNSDSEIQVSEANAYTGTIDASYKSISNLIGIEEFTMLTELYCNNNSISSIDISSNTALTFFQCDNNSLTNLDVGSNTALEFLACRSNGITSLDISTNTALITLRCDDNSISNIDITNNVVLEYFWCSENSLTNLDLANNTAIIQLLCAYNSLTTLDVSSLTALTGFHCYYNSLTSLDLSQNTVLDYIQCDYNQLTSLDVSANTVLTTLSAVANSITAIDVSNNSILTQLMLSNNNLMSLNLQNGNNTNMTLSAIGNSNLSCISVDNSSWSFNNWTFIDANSSFSMGCNPEICDNGIDDDGNGLIDLNDTWGCAIACPAWMAPAVLTTSNGDVCSNNLVLTVGDSVSGQWYKDGIALIGETGSTLAVSDNSYGNGYYTKLGCFISGYFVTTCTEICDNGIDDDGDGAIDLNDIECSCFTWEWPLPTPPVACTCPPVIVPYPYPVEVTPVGTIVMDPYDHIYQSGSLCDSNVVLAYSNNTCTDYQWYMNGIALVGDTSETLVIADSFYSDIYSVRNSCGCNLPSYQISPCEAVSVTSNKNSYSPNDTIVLELINNHLTNAYFNSCTNDELITKHILKQNGTDWDILEQWTYVCDPLTYTYANANTA
ncbi:MAG: hypothetical protein HRT72_04335, partial [Flavobacteriales bacterium]|nr:hypothetical protein [Flavobacteriales bacterium]